MRTRQLLNLEYSALTDANKLIGISKQLDTYDQMRMMVYMSIDQHNIMRQHMKIDLTPVLILDDDSFSIGIVKTKELDNLKCEYEYIVSSFDMLQHFSH